MVLTDLTTLHCTAHILYKRWPPDPLRKKCNSATVPQMRSNVHIINQQLPQPGTRRYTQLLYPRTIPYNHGPTGAYSKSEVAISSSCSAPPNTNKLPIRGALRNLRYVVQKRRLNCKGTESRGLGYSISLLWQAGDIQTILT